MTLRWDFLTLLCILVGITNAEFYAGRAESLLKEIVAKLPEDKEIVAILDPPRAGCRTLYFVDFDCKSVIN